jgi:predicted CXXCH cytochrome family protein
MTLARKPGKPPSKRGSQQRPGDASPSITTPSTLQTAVPGRRSRRGIWITAAIAVAVSIVGGLGFYAATGGLGEAPWVDRSDPAATPAAYVGSETCAGCHRTEAQLWQSSQHSHAMDHATDKSVLGNFDDASFEYYGVRSRFFRNGGKFLVETEGPDGNLATFEVKYTFGIDPLQQYLVEFPDGRLQALPLAWDARPQDKGGQRWFHLHPNEEIKHDDILHWTKLNQNWNFMCAECHSTGVRKNYDAAKDRFATRFSEISVGCEACHGQGSRHVDWANARGRWWPPGKSEDPKMGLPVRFDERRGIAWTINAKSGNAKSGNAQTGNAERNFTPASLRKEVETCGLCHARRGAFSEDWVPGRTLSDTHVVAALGRGLYHADGQMLDEVYNYGSFKQSRMFAAGVTCSDCHEPHGAKLRAPDAGVCLQCHSADKFAGVAHHHHEGANPAPTCVSCHMPGRTYMVVDVRHDHSFRIPRPDLSAKLGTPNACNDCHADKSPEWAASNIVLWHGPNRKGFQNYAEAFRTAWNASADAPALLAAVATNLAVPAIARASALTELAPYVSASNLEVAQAALSDPDPMVRIGALDMVEAVPLNQLWPLASPLLSDSVGGVRIRAAAALAAVPAANLPPADRERFERAAAELVAAHRLNADRPEARSALGDFHARRGISAEAEVEYKAALRLSPQYAPAAINLADLYRQLGRDGDGEGVLRTAISASPRDAGLHYALGLTLTRLKKPDDAVTEFAHAAENEPARARYAYVYAVALQTAGRKDEAMTVLKDSLARHPDDGDTLFTLVTFNRDAGDIGAALAYAERLIRIAPNDPGLAALIEDLRGREKKPDGP